MEAKKVNIIHYVICAAFCLLFRFVPPFGTVTPYGMALIGIFVGLIYKKPDISKT